LSEHCIFGKIKKTEGFPEQKELSDICIRAGVLSGKIQETPLDKILDLLDQASRIWLTPDYHFRKDAVDIISSLFRTSWSMANESVESLFSKFTKENTTRLLRSHLGQMSYLEQFEYVPSQESYIKAQPLGTILHVCSERNFTNGMETLLYGIISKNINILITPSPSSVLPMLFARSLVDFDEDNIIGDTFSIITLPENNREIEPVLKESCDAIILDGNSGDLEACKDGFSSDIRIISSIPKYSFSIITTDGFNESEPDTVFKKCARDVVMGEQKLNSSPHVIYIEKGIVSEFLENFPQHLENINRRFPQAELSLDEKIEILKAREFARIEEADGKSVLYHSSRSSRWTVIYEETPEFRISPANRVIYLKPFSSWAEIFGQLIKMKGKIDTAGILSTPLQLKTLARALAKMGVTRITEIGTMSDRKPGAPEDHDFPLRKLVRWTAVEWVEKRFDLGERVAPPNPIFPRLGRIRNLLNFVKDNSIFYKSHLKNIDINKMRGYEDFLNIPLLTHDMIINNSPPVNNRILTTSLSQVQILSNNPGGNEGFSVYSHREFDESAALLADIFQVSGITVDDVVLNLFPTGFQDVTGIISEAALNKIRCINLPVIGELNTDFLTEYLEKFKPTALIGPIDKIKDLAGMIKENETQFNIRKVLYSGNYIKPEVKDFIRETLKSEITGSTGYIPSFAGIAGYCCGKNTENVYHHLNEYTFLEVIDPETGKPVEKGEAGEIIITSFARKVMPVIRFRTGHTGRILPEPCTCSQQQGFLFEILG
jgi:phenylacetate-CoA ligase